MSETNLDMLFGIPVWDGMLQVDDITKNHLVENFTKMSEDLKGLDTFEAGGWQSELIFSATTSSDKLKDEFLKVVAGHTRKVIKEGYTNASDLTLHGYLVYVKKNEEYIKRHMDAGKSLFTSTVFLTAPDPSSTLIFYNGYPYITPFMESLGAIDYTLTHPIVHYEPKELRIITYPSWLPVGMLPGKSDKNRISIDFYFRA